MASTIIRTVIRRAAAARSSVPFTAAAARSSIPLPSKNGNFVIVRRRIHQNSRRRQAPKAEESLSTIKQLLSEWPKALGALIITSALVLSLIKPDKDEGSSKDLTPSKSAPGVVADRKKATGVTPESPDDARRNTNMTSAEEQRNQEETYWEGVAIYERMRLDQVLKQKNIKKDSYPKFTVGTKDLQVNISFEVPQLYALPLLGRLAADLGLNLVDYSKFTESNSPATSSISLCRLQKKKKEEGDLSTHISSSADVSNTNTVMNFSRVPQVKAVCSIFQEIEIRKPANFSSGELETIGAALETAGICLKEMKEVEKKSAKEEKNSERSKPVEELQALGVTVYGLEPIAEEKKDQISWKTIAGYDQQKREIEDTILLTLRNPEVYDDIARTTRAEFESNRPRGLLFDGPPGTGKTSTARVIASEAGIPLLHVPLEAIISKWYGQAEKNLGKVFRLAKEFPEGSIVFLDEIDSIASSRENNTRMHEVTRRLLSVLLRQIDGFTQDKKVIVIGATNRRQDLDPALLSRFDTMITFTLPDQPTRQNIASKYAKHLTTPELAKLAKHTDGMAGREIKDICIQAERQWASKLIRAQVAADSEQRCRPPLQEYIDSAIDRKRAMAAISYQRRIDQR